MNTVFIRHLSRVKSYFPRHASTNTPHLIIGISVLAAASLVLSDPAVTPGMSTGGASRRGWIAAASLSRCSIKSGKTWVCQKKMCQDVGESRGRGWNHFTLVEK